MNASDDLSDNLQELADYLLEFTHATGVYIGRLVTPKKEIGEEDDDAAHLNGEAPKQVEFLKSAGEGQQFMVGQTLLADEGVTHSVFAPKPEPGEGGEEAPAEGAEEAAPKQEGEPLPDHCYVAEVVREPKVKFYRVPKLGSLLSIRMNYKACLEEEALAEAVTDYLDCEKRREVVESEKREWELEVEREREQKEKDGINDWQPEPREFEDVKEAPYKSIEENYVVCIDTMGQDRELTEEER